MRRCRIAAGLSWSTESSQDQRGHPPSQGSRVPSPAGGISRMQPKEGVSVHYISFILSNPALQPELGRNSRQQQVPGCSSSHFSSFVGSLSARPKILTVPLSSCPVPSLGSSFPHEHPQLLLFSPFSFSQYFLSVPLPTAKSQPWRPLALRPCPAPCRPAQSIYSQHIKGPQPVSPCG